MEDFDPRTPPLASISAEAAVAAARMRASTDTANRPVNVWSVCARLGIEVAARHFSGPAPVEAVLIPTTDGRFRIGVDARPAADAQDLLRGEPKRTRVAFRISHEIGHTLFYGRQGSTQRRVVPWRAEEEAFCDEFASHLLMPDDVLSGIPRTASSLVLASRAFQVPLRAVVNRVVASDPGLTAVILRRGTAADSTRVSPGAPRALGLPTSVATTGRRVLVLTGPGLTRSPAPEQLHLLVG